MTGILVGCILWLGCWLLHRSPPVSRQLILVRAGVAKAGQGVGLDDPALMMDLMAAMLASGTSVERGLSVLRRSASAATGNVLVPVETALAVGASWDVAWSAAGTSGAGSVAELGRALRFAGTTGAPSATIVSAHAAQFRRRRNREAERRAAALGVRLVVPLGLCSLPAFVCLGVIPILVGLFPSFK